MSIGAPFRCCDLPRCNLLTFSCRLGCTCTDAAPAPGGGGGGFCCCWSVVRSFGSGFASPLGSRPLPLFPLSSVSFAMYDWSAVDECGPKFLPTCSSIVLFRAIASLFTCSKIFSVSTSASCIASSIVMSNCCGIGTCGADRPAATLGAVDGGDGGPLLDDAAWKMGACA